MKLIFSKTFKKDIGKLNDKNTKTKLKQIILQLKEVSSLLEISNCIKMKGHPSAYRIRVGNYRLGIYQLEKEIHIARFVKRNDVYKLFP